MKYFLIIDDHEVVRSGIKMLLSEMFRPSEIDEAPNGETALEKIRNKAYDLVMLDIQMPKTDTLGLMEYLKVKYPSLKVLVFSMSPENIYAKRFLKAGAKGFLNKDAPLEEVKKAIEVVLSDKKYVSDSLIDSMTDNGGEKDENLFNTLSSREFEILSLLLKGDTISGIANTLHLQVSTIGTHKARIFEKLNVSNLLELKALADTYKL